jgi:hypothetical protein
MNEYIDHSIVYIPKGYLLDEKYCAQKIIGKYFAFLGGDLAPLSSNN